MVVFFFFSRASLKHSAAIKEFLQAVAREMVVQKVLFVGYA
jgi:hypothetical protein